MLKPDQFNRHLMALSRDSVGYSQSELANKLGVKQGTISKYEAGLLEPPFDFVEALANTLGFMPEFFYETGRPYGMPPFHYRKRKKLAAKRLSKMVAEMNIRRIQLQILLRSYDLPSNRFIPEIDRDEYRGGYGKDFSIEGAAQQLREMWGIPDGPIENVVEVLEDNGGIVIPCNFASDLIDAVSQRIDGLPVLFFVNMNAPADRIRHTLCHELGHMVLHTTTLMDDDEMEKEADHFAGAFLLPSKELKRQLIKFDLRQIANLKRHWKVSMSSIAMRADRLGMITPYQKKSFFIQMGKLGYRKAEPYEPEKEVPTKIKTVVKFFFDNLDFSKEDLAKSLMISVPKFEELYGFIDEPEKYPSNDNNAFGHGLRVVK
ncbi:MULTISPECIES: XRE family transcriptional regulator [Sulfitobacter]|uniref:XRE family transcriptional regulator n=1 Tax=Sulfitobacter profundi TaxID=2679961 RepID=A0ABW1YZD3_9RHOB|nr:XRE family transcriptional regulator [Sulfitobacter indolifex]